MKAMERASKYKDTLNFKAHELELETAHQVKRNDEITALKFTQKQALLQERSENLHGKLERVDELKVKKQEEKTEIAPFAKHVTKY